jgi:hypothetical protein
MCHLSNRKLILPLSRKIILSQPECTSILKSFENLLDTYFSTLFLSEDLRKTKMFSVRPISRQCLLEAFSKSFLWTALSSPLNQVLTPPHPSTHPPTKSSPVVNYQFSVSTFWTPVWSLVIIFYFSKFSNFSNFKFSFTNLALLTTFTKLLSKTWPPWAVLETGLNQSCFDLDLGNMLTR